MRVVMDWLIAEFKKEQGIDLHGDRQACSACAKRPRRPRSNCPSMMETEINLPFITADASGPKHLLMKLTRAKFEQMSDDLVKRLRTPFEQALKDAKLQAERHRRSGAGRRLDPHADGAGAGARTDRRQRAEQEREPG